MSGVVIDRADSRGAAGRRGLDLADRCGGQCLPRQLYVSYTAGLTVFGGRPPASTSAAAVGAGRALARRVANEALPICGKCTVRGAARSRGVTLGSEIGR